MVGIYYNFQYIHFIVKIQKTIISIEQHRVNLGVAVQEQEHEQEQEQEQGQHPLREQRLLQWQWWRAA